MQLSLEALLCWQCSLDGYKGAEVENPTVTEISKMTGIGKRSLISQISSTREIQAMGVY